MMTKKLSDLIDSKKLTHLIDWDRWSIIEDEGSLFPSYMVFDENDNDDPYKGSFNTEEEAKEFILDLEYEEYKSEIGRS